MKDNVIHVNFNQRLRTKKRKARIVASMKTFKSLFKRNKKNTNSQYNHKAL
ncbi:MAG: hypothetical protein ACERKV_03605 [Clostridiaceae bacterium]